VFTASAAGARADQCCAKLTARRPLAIASGRGDLASIANVKPE
jgi:hypothetical protein